MTTRTELSSILKRLLFENDMKPVDLARALNIPQPTIHRIVTAKCTRPYQSTLRPIAEYFHLTVEQLLGNEKIPAFETNQPPAFSDHATILEVPIISWNESLNTKIKRHESDQHIMTTGQISEPYFALRMNDYSMDPFFPKESLLLFDPQKTRDDRSFVLVKLANSKEPVFRQLLIDANHQYLKPLNPDLNAYKMRLLEEKDVILAGLFESRICYRSETR